MQATGELRVARNPCSQFLKIRMGRCNQFVDASMQRLRLIRDETRREKNRRKKDGQCERKSQAAHGVVFPAGCLARSETRWTTKGG